MSVRFGYGHHCQQLIKTVNFRLGASKDLFNLSIQVGKDLIVADSYDEKMNHLPPMVPRKNRCAILYLPAHFLPEGMHRRLVCGSGHGGPARE